MGLGTLGASLLGIMFAENVIVTGGCENKRGKGVLRAGHGKEWDFQYHLIL